MLPVLLLLLAVLLVGVGAFVVLRPKRSAAPSEVDQAQETFMLIQPRITASRADVGARQLLKAKEAVQQVAVGPRAARRRDAQARLRGNQLRHRAQAAAAAGRDSDEDEDDSEGSGSEEEEEGARGKKSKKQRNREARREAAEADRRAREERSARLAKGSTYDEQRRKRDEQREAQEAAQEEEIRRAAAERARKEEEEAAKWMNMISVQEEGIDAGEDAADGAASLIQQFVDYIVARKTVPLEQLATDFKLRTTDVIDRIAALEEQGLLTGMMDERGKYIYVRREEMQAVANYLQQKGRVAISELAARSSTMIDLEPKAAAAAALHSGSALDFDAILNDPVAA